MTRERSAGIKVLQVIPSVCVADGGPSIAIRAIERALGAAGVACETATTDDDGPGRRLARALGRPVPEEGAIRWYFRKNTERYKASWSFVAWVFREVRRFDVVHVHALFSFTSVAAAWAARRAGVPYVVRPLGVLNRYGMTQRRPLAKQLSFRLLEGPLLRGAAAVHFTSEAERDEALALGIRMNPAVIPLGVESARGGDAARFLAAHPESAGRARVLYLSRLDRKKNVEGLVKAMALLARSGASPMLLVAGSGDPAYREDLRALAVAEGVQNLILWLGHLTGDSKADALAAADMFVLPSFSENFGIAVAEALAAGLPCVVGRGVAISTAVAAAGAGLAVEPDAESIAAGLRTYLDSAEARRTAGVAAVALAQREFSVERMGQRLAALYESILARRDGGGLRP